MKRVINKKRFLEGLDFDLVWGIKGLTISVFILLVLIIIAAVLFVAWIQDISLIGDTLLRFPKGEDYLIVFAGIILFVAVPFIIGIKIGLRLKKNKRH